MIITKDILDEKVPKEILPTRLDSAINLYTNVNNQELLSITPIQILGIHYILFMNKIINLQWIIIVLQKKI